MKDGDKTWEGFVDDLGVTHYDRLLGSQASHCKGHCQAVIAVGVDSATSQRATSLDGETIRSLIHHYAQAAQLLA